MSADRVCVLGCTVRDVHFASCAWFGVDAHPAEGEGSCPWPLCEGCAPAAARDGVMVCDRCYGRMRRLISDAPDLVGRLRALADPTSAMEIARVRVSSGSPVAPAPVPDDLVDASDDVMRTLRSWAVWGDARGAVLGGMPAGAGPLAAFRYAARCAGNILLDFDAIANRRDDIVELAELVQVRHPVDEHGLRSRWSIADAVARYRLERPDATEFLDVDRDDGIVSSDPIPEPRWNPLISKADAVKIAGSQQKLDRWRAAGILVARARVTGGRGGATPYFYRDDVLAAKAVMEGGVVMREAPVHTDGSL